MSQEKEYMNDFTLFVLARSRFIRDKTIQSAAHLMHVALKARGGHWITDVVFAETMYSVAEFLCTEEETKND